MHYRNRHVSGRGTDGYGTILPAISAFQKEMNSLSQVFIVGTNVQRAKEAQSKSLKLGELTGVQLPLKFYPDEQEKLHPDVGKGETTGLCNRCRTRSSSL